MAKILIVDDDRALVQLVQDALSRYTTVFASDGTGALHQVEAEHPDLVLLDLRMPGGMDGALLIPMIRRISTVPIVVLSARHEQSDIVGALKAGADDVLAKPFDLYDLEARVEAVLRRSDKAPIMKRHAEFTLGDFVISDSRHAKLNGETILLTATEHKIVLHLMRYQGAIVSRAEMVRLLYGDVGETGHMVDVHVYRARKRLRKHPGAPKIVTVGGRGWSIEEGTP